MGKLTSLLVGMASALILSYYVLSTAYAPILNWLGPLLGYHLNLLMGLFYLLLGIPTDHLVLLGSLVLIAALIGITSAKVGRALGVVTLVIFLSWVIMGLTAFAMFLSFSHGAGISGIFASAQTSSSAAFPSPPPGSDLYSIITEPVIFRIFSFLSEFASSAIASSTTGAGGPSPSGFIGPLLTGGLGLLLEIFIEHLVILYGVSGVTAYLVRKYLLGGGKKGVITPVEPPRPLVQQQEPEGQRTMSRIAAVLLIAIVLGSAFVVLGSAGPTGVASPGYSQDAVAAEMSGMGAMLTQYPLTDGAHDAWMPYDLPALFSALGNHVGGKNSPAESELANQQAAPAASYLNLTTVEGGVSLVTGTGSVYNICGLYNSSGSHGSFFNGPDFSGSAFSIVLLQNNIGEALSLLNLNSTGSNITGISSSSFTSLIPSYVFIVGYNGSLNTTSSLASGAAAEVASQLGIGGFVKLIALSTSSLLGSLGSSGFSLSFYVFIGEADFGVSAVKASTGIIPSIGNGAVNLLMKNSYSTGYTVPGSGPQSATGSMLAMGQINGKDLGSLGHSMFGSNISVAPSGIASFAIGISMWQNRVHYSTSSYNMTLSDLFGYSGSLNLNTGANLTLLAIGHEPFGASPFSIRSYNASLFVSNLSRAGLVSGQFANGSMQEYPSGQSLSTDTAYSSFSGTYTPNVNVSVTGSVSGSNLATLNIEVTDNDNLPMENVTPQLTAFFDSYNSSMKIISSTGSASMGSIQPGQSKILTYRLQLYGSGEYYLPPLVVSYAYAGNHYSPSYTSYTLIPSLPSVAYASTTAMITPLEFIHWSGASFHIGPLDFFEIIILLIILLDVYMEYRHFTKSRKVR